MKILKYIIIALIIFVPTFVWSTTYYIDTAGDNGDNGGVGDPWASLSYACSQVAAGAHTIHINAGNYDSDTGQCILALGVDIEGADKDTTTINFNYSGYYIDGYSGSDSTGDHEISGVTWIGQRTAGYYGMRFVMRDNISIHDCDFSNINQQAIFIRGQDPADSGAENETPPATWADNITIYNNTFTSCAIDDGTVKGAVSITSVADIEIYNNDFDETATTGQTIKSVYGWIKSGLIHDNTFSVFGRGGAINIELWNMCEDTKVYNNTFTTGFLSFVAGQKLAGTWSFQFYNNVITDMMANEFSVDFEEIYGNHFYGTYAGTYGHGSLSLWPTHGTSTGKIETVYIHNNIFHDTSGYAIGFSGNVDYDDIKIYNNTIDMNSSNVWPYSAIFFYTDGTPGTNPITNLIIKNNLIMNVDGPGAGKAIWAYGTSDEDVDSPVVQFNLFDSCDDDINLDGATTPTISDNITGASGITASGDKPGPYYTLAVGSSAIGAGADLGNSLLYGLDPTSTWTDNVKPLDQDDYGDWEIGSYVYIEAGPSGGPGTIAGGGSGTIAGGGTGTIEGTEP